MCRELPSRGRATALMRDFRGCFARYRGWTAGSFLSAQARAAERLADRRRAPIRAPPMLRHRRGTYDRHYVSKSSARRGRHDQLIVGSRSVLSGLGKFQCVGRSTYQREFPTEYSPPPPSRAAGWPCHWSRLVGAAQRDIDATPHMLGKMHGSTLRPTSGNRRAV